MAFYGTALPSVAVKLNQSLAIKWVQAGSTFLTGHSYGEAMQEPKAHLTALAHLGARDD